MVHVLFPGLLCVFAVLHKGLTALIQTQPTTTGLAGDQVCLQCQLTEPKDVHQVTWQKILPGGEKNIGTFNKYSAPRVDPDFIGKVEFKEVGLRNSSIVIRELTEEDAGCYQCVFNCYPDGALIGKTCLHVHKLHGPVLHLRESKSSEELIVSCSATGRPAPTLTITAPQRDLFIFLSEPVSFIHDDDSVTVNQTAVLSRLHDNSTQISCAAQVPFVPQKEVFLMIHEVRLVPTVGDFDEESEVNHSGRSRIQTIALVTTLIPVSALIFLLLKARKKPTSASGRVFELNESGLQTVRVPHEPEAPAEENSPIRQRTTPMKNQESKNITPSPSAVRSLCF